MNINFADCKMLIYYEKLIENQLFYWQKNNKLDQFLPGEVEQDFKKQCFEVVCLKVWAAHVQ